MDNQLFFVKFFIKCSSTHKFVAISGNAKFDQLIDMLSVDMLMMSD